VPGPPAPRVTSTAPLGPYETLSEFRQHPLASAYMARVHLHKHIRDEYSLLYCCVRICSHSSPRGRHVSISRSLRLAGWVMLRFHRYYISYAHWFLPPPIDRLLAFLRSFFWEATACQGSSCSARSVRSLLFSLHSCAWVGLGRNGTVLGFRSGGIRLGLGRGRGGSWEGMYVSYDMRGMFLSLFFLSFVFPWAGA
jgi:hypothetical protein